MRVIAILAAVAMAAGLVVPERAAAEPVTVFAAASLADAMEAVGRAFAETEGGEVRFSFAASSTLARQIEAGAPAQIFVAANELWMDHLAERGFVVRATRTSPIANNLVLVAPARTDPRPLALDDASELARRLGPAGRLAVGDPEHVPAGIYAREALESLGIWDEVEARLAPVDNVRAAVALVERGEAPLGIVYATDARVSDGVVVVATFPPASHAPITYPFAVVTGADNPMVEAFFAFATGEPGLAIFERFGFERS